MNIIAEIFWDFWGGSVGKESACNAEERRDCFDPWVRKIPWRWAWLHTPGFLPGESHGQSSLMGYFPWGHKELDMTEITEYAHIAILCWNLIYSILLIFLFWLVFDWLIFLYFITFFYPGTFYFNYSSKLYLSFNNYISFFLTKR